MNLMSLTAVELGKKIKSGEVTAVDATKAALEQIKKLDGTYNCYVTVDEEAALAEAAKVQKKIEAGELTGPLAGVPVAIKDNMCTVGMLTTCSSRILYNFKPTYSAEAVLNLKKAGAVVIGKTNMDEFAMGSTTETSHFGPTKNPWNAEHVPGGSSGGSCAAVAAEECSFALGSDTGGSIRQPSSFCGVTGIKPTYGTVSRYGLIAYGSSLDQIRTFAEELGLSVAHKPDSQEICFVPDGDYAKFIEENSGKKIPEGNFVWTDGTVIGKHKGITHYTIGQRKGLGLAMGRPVVVTEIRPETGEVVIGEADDVFRTTLRADRLNWMSVPDIEGEARFLAKIRYNHSGSMCTVRKIEEDLVECTFDEPVRAVTPGQAVVFYDGDYVAGGGTIL